MAENLRVSRFRNGDLIPNVTNRNFKELRRPKPNNMGLRNNRRRSHRLRNSN
jgi:hypothetical protein